MLSTHLDGRNRGRLDVAIDAGDGRPVVLVHGLASSHVTFQNVVKLLPHNRVIALDLLGFGASIAPEAATFTIEEHVRALTDAINRLHLMAPFVLVGHSMGALIGCRYAAGHPRRLAGLVLVSPPVYLAPDEFGDVHDRRAMRRYLGAYDFLRRNKWFTIQEAALVEWLSPIRKAIEINKLDWQAFTLSLQNTIETQTTISDIAAVTCPIRVVYGSLDPFIMPAALRILGQMRNVTVVRVPGADHLIRPRMAKEVAKAIASIPAAAE